MRIKGVQIIFPDIFKQEISYVNLLHNLTAQMLLLGLCACLIQGTLNWQEEILRMAPKVTVAWLQIAGDQESRHKQIW